MKLDHEDQRKALLAAIIESSEDAIISKNLQSRVTSWNKTAERMSGYTEQEMLGQLIHTIIPEDRFAEEDFIIESLKHGERIEHYETIRRNKSENYYKFHSPFPPLKIHQELLSELRRLPVILPGKNNMKNGFLLSIRL